MRLGSIRVRRRPSRIRNGGWLSSLALLFTVVALLFVTLPLIMLVLRSINPELTLIPTQFTWEWYGRVSANLGSALLTSALVSGPATVLGVGLAIPAAYLMARREFWGKGILRELTMLPIIIPGVALGVAYLQMLRVGWLSGVNPLVVLIAVHTIIVVPYVIRTIEAGVLSLDISLEEASASLGARPWRTFRRVILPLIVPAILAGGVIGMARSVNDFIITYFLVHPAWIPLSIRTYQSTQYGIPQLTSAYGVVLLLVSLVFALGAEFILRRKVISGGR